MIRIPTRCDNASYYWVQVMWQPWSNSTGDSIRISLHANSLQCTFKRAVSNSISVSNSLLLATILSICAEKNSEQRYTHWHMSPALVSGFLAEQFSTRLKAGSASSSTTGSPRSTTFLLQNTSSSIANAATTVEKFENERAQCRNSDKAQALKNSPSMSQTLASTENEHEAKMSTRSGDTWPAEADCLQLSCWRWPPPSSFALPVLLYCLYIDTTLQNSTSSFALEAPRPRHWRGLGVHMSTHGLQRASNYVLEVLSFTLNLSTAAEVQEEESPGPNGCAYYFVLNLKLYY